MRDIAATTQPRWGIVPQPKHRSGVLGLRNLGQTCYLNSVFQQILRLPAFQAHLLEARFESGSAFEELHKLLFYSLKSRRQECETDAFCNTWIG
jgi:hypothetical protein